MKYTPDKKSIRNHEVPQWFNDAKLGIFIHWGLYSVPAFAVTGMDITETMEKLGIEGHFKNNPYAEWYLNSLRISGSPTEAYHKKTYGENYSYDDFVPKFNEAIKKWNPEEMAELFKKAGAKYVVLVTKHHDGFLLWPSKYTNPNKKNYMASRDIVGDLTKAVKKMNMKMGFYYSGILDWSFQPNPIKDAKSFLKNGVITEEYTEYATNHWYELMEKYDPIILWNDIGFPPDYPPKLVLYKIFADFYNKHPDGVINDRWRQPFVKGMKQTGPHKDFRTPEYQTFKKAMKKKWESTRGIGFSFGYNKFETEKDYMNSEQLVRMFIDIVSKNGNLLLNVGPMADGTIPEIQKKCLLGLGKWLEVNGDAIYGTRPWSTAEGQTSGGIDVRYTQKKDSLYAILLDTPKNNNITIKSLIIDKDSTVQLLGHEENLIWKQENDNLKISIPENLNYAIAYSFKITPKPKIN
ncbi:MAG: alpha-L-fucosidase [Promethearchaeota archaeon]|nr:MAG: alpha-L-fucosidase [Candidatus Lokiarchaeota archaeon]